MGGAIFNRGTLTIETSTFDANEAIGGQGGQYDGVHNSQIGGGGGGMGGPGQPTGPGGGVSPGIDTGGDGGEGGGGSHYQGNCGFGGGAGRLAGPGGYPRCSIYTTATEANALLC